ncbi:putative cation-transporting atpase 4 [Ilyonectria robusta]
MPFDQSASLKFVTIFLLSLSSVIICLRCWIRFSIRYFGLDDWLMLIGQILYIGTCIAIIIGSYNGFGTLDKYLTNENMSLLISQALYCLGSIFIKGSICVTLVRLSNTITVTYLAYAVITINSIGAITAFIIILSVCKPISARWDPSAGHCASTSVIIGASYFLSATSILTDFSCVILPTALLWTLNLKWKVKAPIICMLGFGIFQETNYLRAYPPIKGLQMANAIADGVANIVLWSVVELGIGLSAGSVAALRPLLRWMVSGSLVESRVTASSRTPISRRRGGGELEQQASATYGGL